MMDVVRGRPLVIGAWGLVTLLFASSGIRALNFALTHDTFDGGVNGGGIALGVGLLAAAALAGWRLRNAITRR